MLCQIAKWLLFCYGMMYILMGIVGLITKTSDAELKRLALLIYFIGVGTAAFSAVM